MKYELSQAGYRDFLNTLTFTQQVNRTAVSPTAAVGTLALTTFGNQYRNYVAIKTPSNGVTPAVYGCDANGNISFDEAADGEWVSCSFLSWQDAAAYLDWSGLAPMTEFQYEYMCRGVSSAGSNPASYGEFAWGNNTACSITYNLSGPVTAAELVSNPCAPPLGNILDFNTSNNVFGPIRNGVFAVSGGSRISSGASYFGVMDLSGGLAEYAITVGTVAGRSTRYTPNGDGNISANGYAQLSIGANGFWPGMEGNISNSTVNTCASTCEVTGYAGLILRGGHWFANASNCAIAYRGLLGSNGRNYYNGCRGVLDIR